MHTFVAAFVANFLFIFLKAFQQLNVTKGYYLWVIPTSMMMALCEVYIIALIAVQQFSVGLVMVIGSGAGLGAVSSMYLHKKYVEKIHPTTSLN